MAETITRPKEISWFIWLQAASILYGTYENITGWDALLSRSGQSPATLLFIIVASYALYAVLTYFIGWRASTTGRWIFIALSVAGIFLLIGQFANPGLNESIVSTLLQLGVGLASIALLLMPAVKPWFQKTPATDILD